METVQTIGGIAYSFSKLVAPRQFHIARRMAPLLKELMPFIVAMKNNPEKLKAMASGEIGEEAIEAVSAFGALLGKLSDEDADYILFGLLACANRKQDGGTGWAAVAVGNALMFKDIDMPLMLQLAWAAAMQNFAGFFATLPSVLKSETP